MESIIRDASAKTPKVYLDADKGLIELKGRSIPENAIEFYTPVFNWIVAYGELKKENTVVNMQLEYFNSSSSKCIMEIFKKLEVVAKLGNKVVINWYYDKDDEEIYSAGMEYKSLSNIPFKFVAI